MKVLYSIALSLALISCGKWSGVRKTDLEQIHIPSKIDRYLLANLPNWANFSERGNCRRSPDMKSLHLGNLGKSFSLSYDALIQLQLLFNQEYHKALEDAGGRLLSLHEEERIFFQAQDKISSGILPFRPPRSERVHLLWIDPAINDSRYRKQVAKALGKRKFYQGHPILVSLCLNGPSMEQFVGKLTKEDVDFRFISAEMFSVFNQNLVMGNGRRLALDAILKGKKIVIYTVGGRRLPALVGKFKLKDVGDL